MHRRFDVDNYQSETARWNVEKFVNVAAATGRHSVEETIELDSNAHAGGGPAMPSSAASLRPIRLLKRSSSSSGR